jgi:two-component system phosphate regulon sensor histidine kinase PhoR
MSKRKHSLWLHYGLSAAIVLVTLLTVVWYATDRFHDFFIHHLQGSLESRAITVNQAINDSGDGENNCQVLKASDPEIRVTAINTQGFVLCDSEADPGTMENHAQRPEVIRALSGQRGSIIRFSSTLQTSMLYVAIPQYEDKKIVGVIRTAMPLASIENLLDELYEQFLLLLIVLLIVVVGVIIIVYRKINQPFNKIIAGANDFAHGEFSKTLPDFDIKEISELGVALNRMAEQLDRLENLRRDFVANVSHELKTPIATVKSYVETLLDGAQHDPKDLERFLNIVLKQNDRLAAIVDDLLTLSRLESAPINQLLSLHEQDAGDLLSGSVDICQIRADDKGITINVHADESSPIQADRSLMIQALVNLLDNAIKYSNENTTITLSAETVDDQVWLSVCDQGPGIPEEHIPRLFERFYRVDKSRSRRIGGTGLGLAIVKHIVHIHGGQVEVANKGGTGCCFRIILPISSKSHIFLTQS